MNVVDCPTKRGLPRRDKAPVAVVIHSTGESDLHKVLRYYCAADGLQPHYVIHTTGEVYKIVDEDRIAYHAKIDRAEAVLYRLGKSEWTTWMWANGAPKHVGQRFSGYRQWIETWEPRGKSSPLDLVTGERPNASSVGVELVPPGKRTGRIFTDEQYLSLALLLDTISDRHGIQLDRDHLLGHSDVSPMRRCNEAGSWDPGVSFSWLHLFDLIGYSP